MSIKRLLIATALVLALTGAAAAQTNTGEIGGTVSDDSGRPLLGATATAKHAATGFSVSRVTDERGRFFFPALQTGEWEITISATAFAQQARSGITLEIGRKLDLAFTLSLEGVAQSVVVNSGETLLQTATAEIGDVIETREVAQIPMNGRNVLSLAQLSDGVVLPPGGTRGEALQQAGPLPNIGGQRSGHNIYLLDGVKVTDELFNNLVINPSADSVQEFRILKSMYPAEFGGKASALINVATRSGGNAIHGSLFEYFRDDGFDSPNYFAKDSPVPPLRQHQFGGSLGGPIDRDRTFFFLSYEGLRMNRSLTKAFSVPSDAARSGDLSGFLQTICDPTAACAPFAGNQIPADRIDPVAAAFLLKVPRATGGGEGQNLTAIEKSKRDIDQFSGRLDHRFSDTDQLFARFSAFDAFDLQPFGTSALQESLVPGFGRTLDTRTRNLVLAHTHSFGPYVLNELRFGWMSVKGGQQSLNRGVDFAGPTGILGVTVDPRDAGYPQISTGGLFSTMGDPASFTYRDNQHFELYDNVMLDRGAHRIKFGAYYFHLQMRVEQPDNARGVFTYTGQFTGNALGDFLLGYPVTAVSGVGRGDEDGRTSWLHLYIQDDWHIRRNLTVNAGLRFENNQHMTDARNHLSSVDTAFPGGRFVIASDDSGVISPEAAALLPLMPLPYTTSKDAGWERGLLESSPVRLAPRLGFALTLNDSRTVVRGGYGIFLNQWAYSVQTAFARNLPFFFTKQVDVPVTTTTPTLTTSNILTAPATGTIGANIMNHDYAVEYSQTWSGGIQQRVAPSTVVEAFYMGTWTLGADNATVLNVPEPGPGSIQSRRPIPQLSRINAIRFDGKSIYHGLTLKAERRLRNWFGYNISYTHSVSRDDASSPGPTESESNFPQNVNNLFGPGGEWALSSFDHRHLFVGSGVYELPSLSNATKWIRNTVGGLRLNAVLSAQSGAPFTVNLGVDQANIGAGPAQRPNQMSNPNLAGGLRTPERWFDTSAFALPDPFTFGNAPRNSVTGPGYANVDLAVAKTWILDEPTRIEFRWEIFNLFNRANFDIPNRTFSPANANFGRIFSAKSPREMQFGIRLSM